eukprot:m.240163 g.240163  ORF g.240163 m.240163 type:complete len:79 (+) comp26275_c0_seq1:135-371(+)
MWYVYGTPHWHTGTGSDFGAAAVQLGLPRSGMVMTIAAMHLWRHGRLSLRPLEQYRRNNDDDNKGYTHAGGDNHKAAG